MTSPDGVVVVGASAAGLTTLETQPAAPAD